MRNYNPNSDLYGRPIDSLIVLGYRDVIANFEIDLNYNTEDQEANLFVELDSSDLGKARLSIGLASLNQKVMQTISGGLAEVSSENPMA